MAADDLSAPLGQETKRGRGLSAAIIASLPQAVAIALAAFLSVFVLWVVISDNPFGGEPMAVVRIESADAAAGGRRAGGSRAGRARGQMKPPPRRRARSAMMVRPRVARSCRCRLRRPQPMPRRTPAIPEPSSSSTARPARARRS